MKKTIILIILALACLFTTGHAESYSFREDYDRIDQISGSLFYVEAWKAVDVPDYQATDMKISYLATGKKDGEDICLGTASGFIAFDEHLFITNQHVIDHADYLKIWDDKGNTAIINQVAISDRKKDIAILLFDGGVNYPALEFSEDDTLKRGQPVVTIGSPKGLQNTVAFGNISAFLNLDGMEYIQFTAPISHGSSWIFRCGGAACPEQVEPPVRRVLSRASGAG